MVDEEDLQYSIKRSQLHLAELTRALEEADEVMATLEVLCARLGIQLERHEPLVDGLNESWKSAGSSDLQDWVSRTALQHEAPQVVKKTKVSSLLGRRFV